MKKQTKEQATPYDKGCGRYECIACFHSSDDKKVQHESECAYEDNELRFMCGELTGFAGEDYVFYCSDCKNKIIGYQVGIKERGDSILKMCKECQSGVIEGKAETKKQVLEMMNKLEGSQAETSWLELREQVEKI